MADRITKRRVDAVKPGETIWDGEIRGFGLRAYRGGAKSYVLKYRRGSAQRWLIIGRHGAPFSPSTARLEAIRLLGDIAAGKDPAIEKAANRGAETVQSFSWRYLAEYSRIHKKAASAREDERLVDKHILPRIGNLPIRDIQRSDIARLHRAMRATPYQANRVLALLSHMMNVAADWGVRPEGANPCLRIKRYTEEARERFLSTEELQRLGKALEEAEASGESIYITNALRLLVFTGARLSEILTLKWDDVDFEARLLRLPDSKTGKKTIPLAAPAAEILAGLPRMKDNPYIICGKKTGRHLVNLQKPWRRIRASAGLDDVRIHDLRHSFASVAVAGGMSLPLIGSLLGHNQPQTTQRYAHLADDPRLAAAESISQNLSAILQRKSAPLIAPK